MTKQPLMAFRLLTMLLPACRLKNKLLTLAGYDIAQSAIIGPNLLWNVTNLVVGDCARMGSFNTIKGLKTLHLSPGSILGSWNWISAVREYEDAQPALGPQAASLTLALESCVTSRHYIDCSGGVDIGEFATFAGHRSIILTHGIDVTTSEQVASPVSIGLFALVSSNVKLVPGSQVPPRSVVAMGATVARGLTEPYYLYGGAPARPLKALSERAAYFNRAVGPVDIRRA